MIYTDGVHLARNDLSELHCFAKSVGLKLSWFQKHRRHPHYDITTPRMLGRILSRNRVIMVSTKQLLKLSRNGQEGEVNVLNKRQG